ncbi:hypothetical protein Micbo1qcDRAFT_160116, partial [Microdochium bolleyi]
MTILFQATKAFCLFAILHLGSGSPVLMPCCPVSERTLKKHVPFWHDNVQYHRLPRTPSTQYDPIPVCGSPGIRQRTNSGVARDSGM